MADENCPSCGTPLETDATFCINCGAKRAPAEAAARAAEQPPSPAPTAAATPIPVASPAPPELAPAPAPTPPAVASEERVLTRLDEKLAATPAAPVEPVEPKKKSKKGCCIAVVIVGLVLFLIAACLFGVYGYNEGWFENVGGGEQGYTNDFATASADELTIWQKDPGAVVAAENGMLKVKDALVGINYGAGADYTATCTVVVAAEHGKKGGWAGIVARVNAAGGDRYVFAVLPATKTARIEKISSGAKPEVLASANVAELAVGKGFKVAATVSGQDLTMKIADTVVARTTYIGLAEGPMGLEARGVTAYFDDLEVVPE